MLKWALTTGTSDDDDDDDIYDDHVSLGLKSTPFISNFIA